MWRGDQFSSRRTVGVLILLIFVSLSQWCEFDPGHQQHRSDEHCCVLCHMAPLAALDAVAPASQAPVLAAAWFAPAAEAAAHRQITVSRISSRAPPSASVS
jgi:hypothetical protein